MANYERLSGLDECFLGFETPNSPMHVAVTAIFDQGPLCRPGGGVDLDGVREHLAATAAARAAIPPAARLSAGDAGRRLGRRRGVRSLAARAAREPPAARVDGEAPAALRRDHRAAARPPAAALGGVGGRRPRERRLRVRGEGAPLHRRRDRRHRHARGAPRPDADARRRRRRKRGSLARRPPRASCCATRSARRLRGTREIGRALGRVLSDPVAGAEGLGAAAGSLWRLVRTGLSAGARRVLQPARGPAPAARLAAVRSRSREGDRAAPRRHGERRRPHGGERRDRRGPSPSRASRCRTTPLRAVVPGQRAQRRGVRRSGQPRLALAGAASGGRARPAPAISRRSTRRRTS